LRFEIHRWEASVAADANAPKSVFAVRSADTIVTVALRGYPRMTEFRRIVCPTDFSPTADAAARHAASLARAYQGELVLLHVLPQLHYPLRGLGMAESFPNLQLELHTRAKERLAEAAKALGSGFTLRTEIRDGEAYEQVLACAREHQADVIVLGTHGHTGLKHALLGSTAERVVRLAECPVLTVRTPQ
jgi:universal stress protein A